MLASLEISESLCQTKVDDIYSLAFFARSNHEVVSLDIPVHESLAMDLLKPRDDLDSDGEGGRQGEPLGAAC